MAISIRKEKTRQVLLKLEFDTEDPLPSASLERLNFSSFVFSLQTSFWVLKKISQKIILAQKKNFVRKKFLAQKNLGSKRIFGPKKFGPEIKVGSEKNLGTKKNWV